MRRISLLLMIILGLAACESRFNPLNWFDGQREERIRVDPEAAVEDPDGRQLVSEISQLSVESTTSGAIVRATGITPSLGYHSADLVLVERTDTSIVFEFRAQPPRAAAGQALQEIVAGVSLTNGELAGLRSITVIAQQNRRSVTRR